MDLGNLPKLDMSVLELMQATKAVLTNNCAVTSSQHKKKLLFDSLQDVAFVIH